MDGRSASELTEKSVYVGGGYRITLDYPSGNWAGYEYTFETWIKFFPNPPHQTDSDGFTRTQERKIIQWGSDGIGYDPGFQVTLLDHVIYYRFNCAGWGGVYAVRGKTEVKNEVWTHIAVT